MSRENSKKYPRSVESKNSFLRIRAPENLDIALEGLIRKVLKEQPKMDDIYAFAADYFDMLLKIREKAGIRKLSAQDICPYHNEDDAHEMVKLASSFTKRTKPHSNTYKTLTLRNQDQSMYRKSFEKLDSKNLEDKSKEDEDTDRFENKLSVVKEDTEIEKAKDESVESESIENETAYSIRVSGQDIGEELFIKANEVVTEYNAEDEDSPRDVSGNGPETAGDINELRDKIKAVENEIKRLDNKENKSENDVADGDVVGEGINETGNSDENLEESKSERSIEDVKEIGTGLATETDVQEISVEAESQPQEDQQVKHNAVEQSRDNDVNAENVDELDEELEEQEGTNKNTENEESSKLDVEIELKNGESATKDGNTEATEEVEEAKLNAEAIGEVTRSEAEEVKSAADDAQKVEQTSLEKQTINKETEEENLTGTVGQDETLPEKEKDMMGEENLNSENAKGEILAEGEREATEVQDSEVTDAEAAKEKDVNSGVFEGDTPVSDKTPEESPKPEEEEKIEKQSVDDAGRDINVTDSAVPILIASALNGMEKNVEAPAEELPTTEKILFLRDPEVSIATEIENFLDMEREYSSNEKEAMANQNSVESKIVSRTVSELGTIKENEELVIPGDDTSGKSAEITRDPDELEPDNQEGSTTSDEIEFETSPANYPETDNLVTTTTTSTEDGEIRKETRAETEIIFELDTDDQEIKVQAEEYKKEPNKVLLEVPELKLDENIVRKSELKTMETRSVIEEPEDKIVPICGNVGNEIIQKGEVEKVELVEGEEDILQVHITTTVETEHGPPRDSVHVEMSSWIDPDFRVSVETKVESPVQDGANPEKMQLIRAAVIIQNGFRRFKNKKISEERNNENVPKPNENESTAPIYTVADSLGDSNPSPGEEPEKTLNLIRTRTLVESQSLDSVRKISPLKTRSLSSVRYGAGDFEVWNQLVKELEEAATKIQSNYRGYKSRKKLQRENAIQSTTTSEDSTSVPDPEINHRHTGEFHDSLVLPLDPKNVEKPLRFATISETYDFGDNAGITRKAEALLIWTDLVFE